MSLFDEHCRVVSRAFSWVNEHPSSESVNILKDAVLDIFYEIEEAEENNESVRKILELDKKHSDYVSALDILLNELEKI